MKTQGLTQCEQEGTEKRVKDKDKRLEKRKENNTLEETFFSESLEDQWFAVEGRF